MLLITTDQNGLWSLLNDGAEMVYHSSEPGMFFGRRGLIENNCHGTSYFFGKIGPFHGCSLALLSKNY